MRIFLDSFQDNIGPDAANTFTFDINFDNTTFGTINPTQTPILAASNSIEPQPTNLQSTTSNTPTTPLKSRLSAENTVVIYNCCDSVYEPEYTLYLFADGTHQRYYKNTQIDIPKVPHQSPQIRLINRPIQPTIPPSKLTTPYVYNISKNKPINPMKSPIITRPDNKIYADADDYRCQDDIDPLFNVEDKPPPLSNILLNHPVFNTKNEKYVQKFKELYALETINTANIDIPVTTVDFNIVQPFDTHVTAVADLGANIQAIDRRIADKYAPYLLKDRRKSKVRTGDGYINVQQYLPVHIKYRNKIIHTKFYVIDNLPYSYLIGRSLIRTLGYQLIRQNETFDHTAIPEHYGD